MASPAFRVLIAEDNTPFRNFLCSALATSGEVQVVGQAADGLDVLCKAEELRPDLILLDLRLPNLNGIEVARRIRDRVPECKILFVTLESSPEIVDTALSVGNCGYLIKADLSKDLWRAVKATLRGERFVSSSLKGYNSNG